MNEIEFRRQAQDTLNRLEENLEYQLSDQIDFDLREESLQITLASGHIWLLNRHTPSQELWLSSPFKGGLRFGWCSQNQQWISTRSTQDELFEFLEKDLTDALGFVMELQKI